MSTPLSGHVSPETAYVVDDYPYGFRLRCKIRYWIEFKKGKGFRFVSQTTNPKVWPTEVQRTAETCPGKPCSTTCDHVEFVDVWNKPKASTYARFGGVLVKNEENGHISWATLTEYDDLRAAENFLNWYGDRLVPEGKAELERWVETKRRYEQLKAEGVPFQVAGKIAVAEASKKDEANNG